MPIDLKKYYEQNKNYYGDAPLEEVAKDVHMRAGVKDPFDQWANATGITPQVQEDNYQREVAKTQAQPIGLATEFGRGVVRGAAQGLPEAAGQSLQLVDRAITPEGEAPGTLDKIGKAIETFGTGMKKKMPTWEQSKEAEAPGSWHRAAASAGESTALSATPWAVGAAAGIATGNPLAGIAAGTAAMVPLFYGATTEQKLREGEAAGLSKEDNVRQANIAGAAEVITEWAQDALSGLVFKGLGTPAKEAVKKSVGGVIQSVVAGKSLKEIAKDFFVTGLIEAGGEAANTAIQAASDKSVGLNKDQDLAQDMGDAAKSAFFMTLVFNAFGIPYGMKHASDVRKTLLNPNAPTKDVNNAIGETAHAINEADPELAVQFTKQAQELHAAGKPIIFDDDSYYKNGVAHEEASQEAQARAIHSLAKKDPTDTDLGVLASDPDGLSQLGLTPEHVSLVKDARDKYAAELGDNKAAIDAAPSEAAKQGMLAALEKDIDNNVLEHIRGKQTSLVGATKDVKYWEDQVSAVNSRLAPIAREVEALDLQDDAGAPIDRERHIAMISQHDDLIKQLDEVSKRRDAAKAIKESLSPSVIVDEEAPVEKQPLTDAAKLISTEDYMADIHALQTNRDTASVKAFKDKYGTQAYTYILDKINKKTDIDKYDFINAVAGKYNLDTSVTATAGITPEQHEQNKKVVAFLGEKPDAANVVATAQKLGIETVKGISKDGKEYTYGKKDLLAKISTQMQTNEAALAKGTVPKVEEPAVSKAEDLRTPLLPLATKHEIDVEGLDELGITKALKSKGVRTQDIIRAYRDAKLAKVETPKAETVIPKGPKIAVGWMKLTDMQALAKQAGIDITGMKGPAIARALKEKGIGVETPAKAAKAEKVAVIKHIHINAVSENSLRQVAEQVKGVDSKADAKAIRKALKAKGITHTYADEKTNIRRPVLPVDKAAHEAATSPLNSTPEPTEAQIEAGNYKKGHVSLQGLDISIENPKGSVREGVSKAGKKWAVTMKQHYGYIKGTVGKDKDHIDTFIGDKSGSQRVFIVNQVDPKTKKFDEHKVMLGFEKASDAEKAYLSNYEKGWKGKKSIVSMTMDQFKEWIKAGNTKAEAKTVVEAKPEKKSEKKEVIKDGKSEKTSEKTREKTASKSLLKDEDIAAGQALSMLDSRMDEVVQLANIFNVPMEDNKGKQRLHSAIVREIISAAKTAELARDDQRREEKAAAAEADLNKPKVSREQTDMLKRLALVEHLSPAQQKAAERLVMGETILTTEKSKRSGTTSEATMVALKKKELVNQLPSGLWVLSEKVTGTPDAPLSEKEVDALLNRIVMRPVDNDVPYTDLTAADVTKAVKRLLNVPRVPKSIVIIDQITDLDPKIRSYFGDARYSGAAYDGKMYLIANEIENVQESLKGLIIHEGAHHLLRGDKSWNRRWTEFRTAMYSGLSFVDKQIMDRAMARLEQDKEGMSQNEYEEEMLAYYLEAVAKDLDINPHHAPKYNLWQKFKKWIAGMFFRWSGLSIKQLGLNNYDLVRMIRSDLRKADYLPHVYEVEGIEALASRIAYHFTPEQWQPERPMVNKSQDGLFAGYGFYSAKSKHEAKAYIRMRHGARTLYKLEIPDSVVDKLMKWDEPFSAQNDYVKARLEPFKASARSEGQWEITNGNWEYVETEKGAADPLAKDIYWGIAHEYSGDRPRAGMAGQEHASMVLAEAGIPGNMHHESITDRFNTPDLNYVIWDQGLLDRVNILETRHGVKTNRVESKTLNPPHPMSMGGENRTINRGKSWLDYEIKDDKVTIHDVLVDKTHRRKGLATQMIHQVIEENPEKPVYLGAVSKEMDKLAEKLGFELVSPRNEYMPESGIPDAVNSKTMNTWEFDPTPTSTQVRLSRREKGQEDLQNILEAARDKALGKSFERPESEQEARQNLVDAEREAGDSIARYAQNKQTRLLAEAHVGIMNHIRADQERKPVKPVKGGIPKGVDQYKRTEDTQTTNIFTRVLSLPEYYMRKDSTAEKVLEAALKQSEVKYKAEKMILSDTFIKTVEDIQKNDPRSYKAASDYLLETDKTGKGYSVSYHKGQWHVMSPINSQIFSFSTEKEAVVKMVSEEQVDLRSRKFSENSLAMVKEVRDLTNRGFDIIAADMNRQIKRALDNGLAPPTTTHINEKGEREVIALSDAISEMGDLRGTYFPRERPGKSFVLTAQKKDGSKKELRTVSMFLPGNELDSGFKGKVKDWINAKLPVNKDIKELMAKGYTADEIAINPVKSVSEAIYDVPGLLTATDSLLAAAEDAVASENMSDTEIKLLEEISKRISTNIGDIYKAKGSFSSRIKRAAVHWEGYETDPLKALTSYTQRLAAGVARRTTARRMLEAFTGREVSWAQFREQNPTAKYKDYRAEVKRKAVSAVTQKALYDDVRLYMNHVLRPDNGVDRFVGYLKGLTVLKFLGLRVSSAAVNMTNMVMAAPATIAAHTGISVTKALGEITTAAAKYAKYRAEQLEGSNVISSAFKSHLGKTPLSEEDRQIFSFISSMGWDEAQFNQDSVRVLQDTANEVWNKAMAGAMYLFGATEKANRAITIFAATKAHMKANPNLIRAEAMEKAVHTSNRAHGVYGKAAKPWLVQKVRFLDMPYTFFKFQQNYMLNMLEIGMKYNRWGTAVPYMLMSPAVLSGAGASLLTPLVAACLKAAGAGDDPEEEFYKWAEETFGSDAFMRHGIAGLAGINLKGSLEITSPFPDLSKGYLGAMGPPGGIFLDLSDAVTFLKKGEYEKGIEKLLPTAAGSMVKGYREYNEGLTDKNYAPVFYGSEQLKGTGFDMALRFFSFNPERISGLRQAQWREDEVRRSYQERRSGITEGFNHLLSNIDTASNADFGDLYKRIQEYNEDAFAADSRYAVTPITSKWLLSSIKRSQKPTKFEKARAVG